ncbi:integral membrane protein (Pth11) [Aspergillus bombycis]|uniref:Integral membrane protein (Pth11) n=1 Tax=Aspergillus bombycis TaxID=109264 RepID=A0A1F8A8B4_9EURO|nr:integral membrane protein (Pth11) [Aspergillus bombycis]OGM47964.1 integral membrane protein (Pth11) [Aspergillus bombycis]
MDLSKIPVAPPPPGVTPNFDNPEGSKFKIYSVSIAMCSSATLVLLLRLYTRFYILRTYGLDDLCCVMGQICAWIFAILSLINVKNGYGVHVWDLHLDTLTPFKKQYDLAEEDIYALGVWFVKTAILLFYLRLSPEKRFRQMTFAIMVFVAFYSLLSILIFTLGCNPVRAMWDVTIQDAKCVDQFAFVYANAAFNVFSDLVTLILPIKICWSLQTSLRQRMLLMVVFGTGSFCCVVAILRIVTMMPYIHSNDFTHFKVTLANWCMIEINVGIICACLPTMRPLLARSFPRIFSSIDRSNNKNYKGSAGSYSLKPRRKIHNWDHLTTLQGTQLTTQDPENRKNSESVQELVKPDGHNEAQGIMTSTEYSVTYNRDHSHLT